MKHCTGCKQEKELSEFNKDLTKADGKNYKCRVCLQKYKTPKAIQPSHSYRDYIEKAGLQTYKQTYLRIN